MLNVLIAAHSPADQGRLARALQPIEGVKVIGCASDAGDATTLLDKLQPDVVVLDAEWREGDSGLGLFSHVVRHSPEVEVLVLSNFTWDSVRASFLSSGARAYFDKPNGFPHAMDWIAQRAHARPPQP